jgi:hypothetical protein
MASNSTGKHKPLILAFYITGGTGIINKDAETGKITTQHDIVKIVTKFDFDVMIKNMKSLGYDRIEIKEHGELESSPKNLGKEYYEEAIKVNYSKAKPSNYDALIERIKYLESKVGEHDPVAIKNEKPFNKK